jgi:hypothetical protein
MVPSQELLLLLLVEEKNTGISGCEAVILLMSKADKGIGQCTEDAACQVCSPWNATPKQPIASFKRQPALASICARSKST